MDYRKICYKKGKKQVVLEISEKEQLDLQTKKEVKEILRMELQDRIREMNRKTHDGEWKKEEVVKQGVLHR